MEVQNVTKVTEFLFTGLEANHTHVLFLFILFLMVYLITIIGNSGMVALVCYTPHLQTPMYCFLGCLSMVDLCYSSVIAPKMLADLGSRDKSISFIGCALQFFFFAALAVTEALLLSCMSYDRYVAICRPLHYSSIMTKNKCLWLILMSFSIGFSQSSVQTKCIFSLEFCRRNQIDHFYCDVPPLLKISCSETFHCNMVTVFFICSFGVGSMVNILVSYTLIVSSVLQIKSSSGRGRAFSTCSSHLTCVCIFYWTVFFIYLRSSFDRRDKVASVFYTMVIPMLNPLIYSLRNQEVKKAFEEMLNKKIN
ncbi:olfactory receptor 1444-like, partial [Xenopus tropicalis]|uniref:Olfactory receptor n=1 Tax=Xenopus tropicalis TaxID=8364 RepID=A0A8J1JBM7_XENTR